MNIQCLNLLSIN